MLKICYTVAKDTTRCAERKAAGELVEKMLEREGLKDFLLAKTKSGKPYIVGSDLKLGITHKNGYVFVAVSDGEVGIDFEKIANNNPIVANRIMPAEVHEEYLKAKDPALFLYGVFSAREAFSKLSGVGFPFLLSKKPVTAEVMQKVYDFGEHRYVLSVCGEKTDGFSFDTVERI